MKIVEEKLKELEDNDIIDLNKINKAIYDRFYSLIQEQEPPFREDFFEIERFSNINKSQIFKLMVFLIRDMKIFEGKERNGKAFSIIFLNENHYKQFLNFKNIIEEKVKEIKYNNPNRVKLNKDRSILFIDNNAININKYSPTFYVLKTLFQNPHQECFFDEVYSDDDEVEKDLINVDDKKYYNAVYQLNKKIKEETSIDKFFITTRHSIKIDEKYLS